MRALLISLLIGAYLLTATECGQVLKVPALLQHLQHHRSENPGMTVWNFLSMHYAHGNPLDADHEQDSKLPFKSHDDCAVTSIASVPASSLHISHPMASGDEALLHYDEHFLSNALLSCIWQPPQAA